MSVKEGNVQRCTFLLAWGVLLGRHVHLSTAGNQRKVRGPGKEEKQSKKRGEEEAMDANRMSSTPLSYKNII